MKNLYTIPPGISFVDALARGILTRSGEGKFALADQLILLPTRRSARALGEAFLRQMKATSSLLPRMQPLGDIDEEELYFADTNFGSDIPEAVSPLRRQLLLTQLVAGKDKDMPLDQAAQLAKALGEFLDQTYVERCDMGKLRNLVQDIELAKHWEQTVQFLGILTENWPEMLTGEDGIDPGDRQNRVLEAQAEAWRKNPPAHPVTAAGTTGSIPATADLLDVIASMPQGAVILPGLDREMSEEAWQQVEEGHPQFGMKSLLEKFGVARRDVKDWPGAEDQNENRIRLLRTAMLPPDSTGEWRGIAPKDIPLDAVQGLSRLELDHPQEEAQAIALLMRNVLEKPEKTAVLVTPDRELASRVLSLLKRWGIAANDSAGTSLAATPIGAFLTDILASASDHSPVACLSLLKHPYTACGMEPSECRAHARAIEIDVWRQDPPKHNEWLDVFKEMLRPLNADWAKPMPLSERVENHIRLAETLAASDTEVGAERLWKKEDGKEAAAWMRELGDASADFPMLTGAEYQSLFLELLAARRVRPRYGQHPRLSILGPIEARLIQSDLTILGGLNEGTWPPEAPVDPWMSRPMRAAFGLPMPERRIGLAAHDFAQLAASPEVVLTRSKRAGNAPTVPSRFLLQLETVLKALGYSDKDKDALAPKQPWALWARMIDDPGKAPEPAGMPEPRPPASVRPRTLSVTEIGLWRRNPYAIYAKHILGLRKLEPLEAEIDARDRGQIIHTVFERFMNQYGAAWSQDALEKLLEIGREVFATYEVHPEVKAFWQPRFERVASWFIEHEEERRAEGKKFWRAEAGGKVALGDFTLRGRADRIDRLPDQSVEIIDYKTGKSPSFKQIKAGYEPQLPLLALIAEQGGFTELGAVKASALAHWELTGGREGAEEKPVKDDPKILLDEARAGLEQLIKVFSDPATPYQSSPKGKLKIDRDDYAHLARRAEWGIGGGDE